MKKLSNKDELTLNEITKLTKIINYYDDLYYNKNDQLTDDKNPFYEYNGVIKKTIPFLKTLEGKTIKPHLNIIKQNSTLKNIKKDNSFSLYLINRILV